MTASSNEDENEPNNMIQATPPEILSEDNPGYQFRTKTKKICPEPLPSTSFDVKGHQPTSFSYKLSSEYGYGIRHLQALCMCLCMLTLFIGRSVLAVAVLAMTDVSRINDTNIEIYDWDKKTQGVILSSFFWGYVIMQIPGGILARKYGGKTIILIALLINFVLCLALPTLAHYGGWMCVCACRVCMGLSQACLFPATHTMCGRWLHSSERTGLLALVYGGHSLGTIIGMPLAGILSETALGWKMIFYVTAALKLITAVIWYWFAASSPAEHRMVSEEEKEYIEKDLNSKNQSQQNRPTPWRCLFRCVPLWAIMGTHVASVLAFTFFFVDLPTFLDKAMNISIKNSAFLSALPYIGSWVGGLVAANLGEKIYNRGVCSLNAIRKIFNSIAQVGIASGCIVLAFLEPDQKAIAVIAVVVSLTMMGFIYAGFMVNPLDLSPQYAGVMMSLTNFASQVFCVFMPILTGIALKNDPSNINNWRIVFLVLAGLVLLMNVFYVIFGSTERQPWDTQDENEVATIDEMKPLKNTNITEVVLKQ